MDSGYESTMRDYPIYWRLIVSRAWARSWGAVIERSFWAILRDALFLGVAAYAVFALKGIIAKLHSPVDVRASGRVPTSGVGAVGK